MFEKRKGRKGNERIMMNIYQKIHAITHELNGIAKTMTVKLPNGSYKAVSEGDVLNAVKPLLDKYLVLIVPVKRETVYGDPYLKYKNDEKIVFYSRIKTTYSIINVEKPEETITTECYGDGVDPMDKSIGKAITYCDKYNILKLFMLITGEDADQTGSVSLTEEPNANGTKKYVPTEPETPASDKQLRYIEGLRKSRKFNENLFFANFGFMTSAVQTNEQAKLAISFLTQCPKIEQEPKADEQGIIVDDDLPF